MVQLTVEISRLCLYLLPVNVTVPRRSVEAEVVFDPFESIRRVDIGPAFSLDSSNVPISEGHVSVSNVREDLCLMETGASRSSLKASLEGGPQLAPSVIDSHPTLNHES